MRKKKNNNKLISPLKERSLKIKTKIFLLENKIKISPLPFTKLSNNNKKKIKSIQGTTKAQIKQLLIELSSIIYSKLKFIGTGFKIFNVENYQTNLVMFKLGFSHVLYFKIPNKLNFFCLKSIKLLIFGSYYNEVCQASSLIKSYKLPDPYKGKGILYEHEKIALKKGKKI